MLNDTLFLLKLYFKSHGADILVATIFFVLAVLFSFLAGRFLNYMLRSKFDVENRIVKLIVRTFRITIITLAVLTLLSEFGISVTSLLAGLGVVGFGLAIGMRTSINNFITGMMLNALNPYEEGDFIEGANIKGVVESVSLFHTVISTTDGTFVSVPNGPMWAKAIKNLSRKRPGLLDFVIKVKSVADAGKLRDAVTSVIVAEPMKAKSVIPLVRVESIAGEGLTLRGGLWCEGINAIIIANRVKEQLSVAVADVGAVLDKIDVSYAGKTATKKTEEPADSGDDFT